MLIALAEPKASKRRRRTVDVLDNSAECGDFVVVVGDILRSTEGVEFSASVAGAGMLLMEFILQ